MSREYNIINILLRAHVLLIGLGVLYGVAVLIALTPFFQTHVVYAHRIKFFGYGAFDHPEKYGLAPGKTANLKLHSSDNTTIGAWFIFADNFYHSLPYPPSPIGATRVQEVRRAVEQRPTILFLHGNTGTRALELRITVYTGITSRLDANILAIDYRGFGDSEGCPTVEGVAKDAKAGWDYLVEQGAQPENILIVGHSLGSAIAGKLSAQLNNDDVTPRGLVLLSPFSSIRLLMDQYHLFGFLPLLKPLASLPFVPRVLTWSVAHNFDTLSLVPDIKCSVLIVHAEDDWDIQPSHSSVIFNALLEPYLPASHIDSDVHHPFLMSSSDWYTITHQQALRAEERNAILSRVDIPKFGTLETFIADERKIAFLKLNNGGHDIGRIEGVQDVLGRFFDFL